MLEVASRIQEEVKAKNKQTKKAFATGESQSNQLKVERR